MAEDDVTGRRIQVANARPEDAGRGLARLPLAVQTIDNKYEFISKSSAFVAQLPLAVHKCPK